MLRNVLNTEREQGRNYFLYESAHCFLLGGGLRKVLRSTPLSTLHCNALFVLSYSKFVSGCESRQTVITLLLN